MAWKGIAGVLGAAAFAAAGVYVGRATARAPDAAKPPPAPSVNVKTSTASEVLATGAVRSQVGAEVQVGARISGRVSRLMVKVGDHVAAGQEIAEIEHADLDAKVQSAEADLAVAQASLALLQRGPRPEDVAAAVAAQRQVEAQIALDKLTVQRRQSLVDRGMLSPDQLDDARSTLAVAQAQLDAARQTVRLRRVPYLPEEIQVAEAKVAQAQAALDLARIGAGYAIIRSPIDGVVGSVSTQEGETVAAGMSAPTFITVLDLRRLQVEAYVDEVDIGRVHPGLKATFTVDTFPEKTFAGTVTAIYPKAVLQDNVVNYLTIVSVDDPQGLLRPEMTANVTIELGDEAAASDAGASAAAGASVDAGTSAAAGDAQGAKR